MSETGFVDQGVTRLSSNNQGMRFMSTLLEAGKEFPVEDAQSMVRELLAAERLSLTFRFKQGSSRLDTRGEEDVQRLAELLKNARLLNKELVFIGFTLMELPFLGIQSLEAEVAVSHALYAHPVMVKDLGRWNAKLLMATPLPQYNLVGMGAAPTGIKSLEGARIRATGGIGQAFKRIGAEPVSATATETYGAMESGDVEMVAFAQHAHFAFRTINLGDWWTSNLNPGTLNCPVVVNQDAYDALPAAHRAALDAAVEPALRHYLTYYQDLIHKWDEILELFGVEKVSFSEEDIAVFRERAARPVREAWIAEHQSDAFPARDLLDAVTQAIEDYRAGRLASVPGN